MNNKVSVIIPHWKGRLYKDAFKSLLVPPEDVYLASSIIAYHPPQKALRFQRNEPTYKRNYTAFTQPMREYICFMDDDVEVHYRCIERMAGYLDKHKDVGMVYALLLQKGTTTIDTAGSWLTSTGFLFESYEYPEEDTLVLSGKSACCMIRRDLFFEIGGFDEDFVIYGEETDLSWRVWLAGHKVVIHRYSTADHAFGSKIKGPEYYNKRFIHYHGCKNYITMLIKNLQLRNFWMVGINFSIWTGVGICFLFRNRQVSKWIFQGLWYVLTHLPLIWKKRQKIQKNRKHSDKELFKYIMHNPGWKYYFNRIKDYLTHQLHRRSDV